MSQTKQFKRVLLKISGEQLAGKNGSGIDLEYLHWLSGEVKQAVDSGTQIVIVVGGGNWLRGANFAKGDIERATADYMGMIATVMNGLSVTDTLEANGQPTRLQSNIHMNQVAEPFIRRRAIRHLEKGRVVIIAGGLGKPYLTTDTVSVSVALELGCEIVLKATNVDGVYDKDPVNHKDAKLFDEVSFQEAVENPGIKVMDKAALGLAMEQKMPIAVFNLNKDGNIAKVVSGEKVGTLIS